MIVRGVRRHDAIFWKRPCSQLSYRTQEHDPDRQRHSGRPVHVSGSANTRSIGELLAHIAAVTHYPRHIHVIDKRTELSGTDFGPLPRRGRGLRAHADLARGHPAGARGDRRGVREGSRGPDGRGPRHRRALRPADSAAEQDAIRAAAGREGARDAPSRTAHAAAADDRRCAAPHARARGSHAPAARRELAR